MAAGIGRVEIMQLRVSLAGGSEPPPVNDDQKCDEGLQTSLLHFNSPLTPLLQRRLLYWHVNVLLPMRTKLNRLQHLAKLTKMTPMAIATHHLE